MTNYKWLVVSATVRIIALAVGVFILAGRVDYWQGWVFACVNVGGVLLLLAVFRDKADVLWERIKPGPGQKSWDKIFLPLFVPLYIGIIVVASLDGGRFGWTGQMQAWIYAASLAVYLASYFVLSWAMWVNRFFSSAVRIQTERGHQVVQTGPYRYVRHPGYVAGILLMLSNSVVLGSLWGLIPASVAAVMLIWRTYMEDKTLREELAGYSEYAAKVKYRLAPGLW